MRHRIALSSVGTFNSVFPGNFSVREFAFERFICAWLLATFSDGGNADGLRRGKVVIM